MENKKIIVIGSSNTDMMVRTGSLPVPGQTVLGGVFSMGAGGKGANQAVAAARLGGDVTLVCKVGRDLFGDNSVSQYAKEGLDTSHILRSDSPSGVALITVDDNAENCIVVAPGANLDITTEDIDDCAELIRAAGILLLQLEIPVPAVMQAARIAHEAGVLVVLNSAPYTALPDELFRYVDIFIPNETELSAFSGKEVTGASDACEAGNVMLAKGIKNLIVTLGSKGSIVYDGRESELIPALKVKAVDTTAAGDTYCGALCVALAEGCTLKDAAAFATRASAIAVTRLGAQASMPYRNEV